MTTYEQRELAGVSPITVPMLPSESKHTLDDRRDEARLHRIEAKELRLFNQPMVNANEHTIIQLKETLNDRDTKIVESLKNCKNIPAEEALHVPYVHYQLAA